METPKYTQYSSDYTDQDKAYYDSLVSQGMNLVGTKIKENEIWLLHIAAKITINEHKGFKNDVTAEEIEITRQNYTNAVGVFDTPAHLYEGGMIRTECGKIARHPLDFTPEEINSKYINEPEITENPVHDIIE